MADDLLGRLADETRRRIAESELASALRVCERTARTGRDQDRAELRPDQARALVIELDRLRARVAELEAVIGRVDEEYADDGEYGTDGEGLVWLRATVEPMGEWTEFLPIARAEWNAMTPRQRMAAVDQFGADVLGDAGGYGVSVVDEAEVPDDERRVAQPEPPR